MRDACILKKIISVLHLIKDGRGEEIVTGAAAKWSLASNAAQHKKVYEICKSKLQNSQGSTKELLQDIISQSARSDLT